MTPTTVHDAPGDAERYRDALETLATSVGDWALALEQKSDPNFADVERAHNALVDQARDLNTQSLEQKLTGDQNLELLQRVTKRIDLTAAKIEQGERDVARIVNIASKAIDAGTAIATGGTGAIVTALTALSGSIGPAA